MSLSLSHVPGVSNVHADILSRQDRNAFLAMEDIARLSPPPSFKPPGSLEECLLRAGPLLTWSQV